MRMLDCDNARDTTGGYLGDSSKTIGADYVVFEQALCERSSATGLCGCSDMWDVEDSENVGRQPVPLTVGSSIHQSVFSSNVPKL